MTMQEIVQKALLSRLITVSMVLGGLFGAAYSLTPHARCPQVMSEINLSPQFQLLETREIMGVGQLNLQDFRNHLWTTIHKDLNSDLEKHFSGRAFDMSNTYSRQLPPTMEVRMRVCDYNANKLAGDMQSFFDENRSPKIKSILKDTQLRAQKKLSNIETYDHVAKVVKTKLREGKFNIENIMSVLLLSDKLDGIKSTQENLMAIAEAPNALYFSRSILESAAPNAFIHRIIIGAIIGLLSALGIQIVRLS